MAADPNNPTQRFVGAVLATTEDAWDAIFREAGRQYQRPQLQLFSGRINSACGLASAASGPFYCPTRDPSQSRIYLDTSFFRELERRFGAPGDFAAAYVIGHEVGHHVQHLLGRLELGQQQRQNLSKRKAMRCRFASSCRPTAMRASGRIAHTPRPPPGGRRRRGDASRSRNRRRHHTAALAGPGRAGELHARHVRAAHALVHDRAALGQPGFVRYLRQPADLGAPPRRARRPRPTRPDDALESCSARAPAWVRSDKRPTTVAPATLAGGVGAEGGL